MAAAGISNTAAAIKPTRCLSFGGLRFQPDLYEAADGFGARRFVVLFCPPLINVPPDTKLSPLKQEAEPDSDDYKPSLGWTRTGAWGNASDLEMGLVAPLTRRKGCRRRVNLTASIPSQQTNGGSRTVW